MMTMHLTKQAPSISTICPKLNFPAKLESLVSRSLSKDPKDRPQTMRQFAEELKSVQAIAASAEETLDTISRITARQSEVVSQTELASMVNEHLESRKNKIDKYEEWKEGLAKEQMEELKWKTNPKPKPTWQAPASVKFVTFLQTTLPYALTLALLAAVFWFAYREPRVSLPDFFPLSSQNKHTSPEDLMNQGNLKEAMDLWKRK